MPLWWHFSVRKDRKTKQKGLTPYTKLIKQMHVTASATWCYHGTDMSD